MGQKSHSLTLSTKVTTSANYTEGIGTGYSSSHDKEIGMSALLQNQSIKFRPVLML